MSNQINFPLQEGLIQSNGITKTLFREPKCALCRNHGQNVRKKGHKRKCPYEACPCTRCQLILERRDVLAKQVSLRRAHARKERNARYMQDILEEDGYEDGHAQEKRTDEVECAKEENVEQEQVEYSEGMNEIEFENGERMVVVEKHGELVVIRMVKQE